VLQYDFENSIGYWLCLTSQTIRRELSNRLAEVGITLRQWEVLAWLESDGSGCQNDLAECLGIEPHTLGGILSRMERDGWVERTSCEFDRRRNQMKATTKAEQLWEQSLEVFRAVRTQATRGLSPGELTFLKSICEAVRENLNTEAAETVTPDLRQVAGIPQPKRVDPTC